MQEDAFLATLGNNGQQLNPLGADPGDLWSRTAFDNQLSIRAAAFHLQDLMEMQGEHAGAGKSFSRDQLAAVGYNVGGGFMLEIAGGTYSSTYGTSQPTDDNARNYLNMYNTNWTRANTWLCGQQVLVC